MGTDMTTASASFLARLATFLVGTFVPPEEQACLDGMLDTYHDDLFKSTDTRKNVLERALDHLVDDLSRLLLQPEAARERFNRAPVTARFGFYDRYQFAVSHLSSRPQKTLPVPTGIQDLFRWFFIDFWHKDYHLLE